MAYVAKRDNQLKQPGDLSFVVVQGMRSET
jgi:hypothetical protein